MNFKVESRERDEIINLMLQFGLRSIVFDDTRGDKRIDNIFTNATASARATDTPFRLQNNNSKYW